MQAPEVPALVSLFVLCDERLAENFLKLCLVTELLHFEELFLGNGVLGVKHIEGSAGSVSSVDVVTRCATRAILLLFDERLAPHHSFRFLSLLQH